MAFIRRYFWCAVWGVAPVAAAAVALSMLKRAGSDVVPKQQHDSASVITFESLRHDFGRIAENRNFSCAFRFKNNSNAVIHITELRPSCGCIASSAEETGYAPGEYGNIKVDFTTEGMRAPEDIRKSVTVTFDPGSIKARLLLCGTVVPPVVAEPTSLSLSNALGREERVLIIRGTISPSLFRTVDLRSTEEALLVRPGARDDETAEFFVRLRAGRRADESLIGLYVIARRENGIEESLQQIACRTLGPKVTPRAFVLAVPRDTSKRGADAQRRSFVVRGENDEFLSVDELSVRPSELARCLEWTVGDEAMSFLLSVTNSPASPTTGVVEVKCHYPERSGADTVQSIVCVPVRIRPIPD